VHNNNINQTKRAKLQTATAQKFLQKVIAFFAGWAITFFYCNLSTVRRGRRLGRPTFEAQHSQNSSFITHHSSLFIDVIASEAKQSSVFLMKNDK